MITIVPYDEAWPSAFQSEAKLIRSALLPLARRVEHVGSTSMLAAENHGTTLESRERYFLSKSDFVAAMLKLALSQGKSSP